MQSNRACPRDLTVYVHGVMAVLSFVHRVYCAMSKVLLSKKVVQGVKIKYLSSMGGVRLVSGIAH